jgi:hypothetical protein
MAANFFSVSPFISAQSLGASFTSSSFSVGEFDRVGLQITVADASSLNGSLQLQASINGTNWVNVGTATTLTANTSILSDLASPYYKFIRFDYVRTAGSGTLNVVVGSVNLAR